MGAKGGAGDDVIPEGEPIVVGVMPSRESR
jgi:hypothetical protein